MIESCSAEIRPALVLQCKGNDIVIILRMIGIEDAMVEYKKLSEMAITGRISITCTFGDNITIPNPIIVGEIAL